MASTSGLILVTGGAGFVGARLAETLVRRGYEVRCAVRDRPTACSVQGVEYVALGDFGRHTDWQRVLSGVRCIVHLAARTHVLHDTAPDPLAAYRRTNVAATEKLARDAIAAGVERLVFASSIKVNGERTAGHPFTENDTPRPEDAYGQSKMEAESALRAIAGTARLEAVVIRPPLVYGPRVKGNFKRLLALADRGVPLPLGSVDNRRSLMFVDNLVDALCAAALHPAAAGKTYLVSDGEDISTPQLYRLLANSLGRRVRVPPCPVSVLEAAAALCGKKAELARLIGSLRVDSSKIRRELGWHPPFALAEGLACTARWYHSQSRRDTRPY